MAGGSTDTVPARLTPGEFVIKRESAEMLGLPFLRRLNAVSDNAAHSSMDALIAQSELAGMKPMYDGGEVAPGYENGGSVPKSILNIPFSLLANILNKPVPRTSTVLSPEEQILMELESGAHFPKTDVPSPEEEILSELINVAKQKEQDRPIASPFKGYQDGDEVAPADATANAIMSQLLLKEVAQQSPEYYYSEERGGYDPAKEIAEGSFMPIGGVISGAKGLMRLPTHTTGTPLAKGIKKAVKEADELLKRTRKPGAGLKKKLINEIDEAGLPDAYGEPMSYFKDLHTDDLADILKEYYGKELYQANRGLHGLLKASGYQEGDVVGYQQGEQVVDPNDPLGINKRQAMGAQAYAGSTIAGAGGGVSVGDVAEAVEIDEMQKVNQAMEALKLQGIYNEPERSGYFEFQGDVPQSEADQMRMVFSLLRDMENQKALNQLLMQSGRMGGQLNPIHQGLFFKP